MTKSVMPYLKTILLFYEHRPSCAALVVSSRSLFFEIKLWLPNSAI